MKKNTLVILFFSLLVLFSCEQKKEMKVFKNASQIKVLNGCGVSKIAQKMTDYLMSKGFDVVEKGNAEHWHYKKTVVVATDINTEVAEQLSKYLNNADWIPLEDSSQLVDAVVIVGHDFFQLLK